jgi:hypothetical protein
VERARARARTPGLNHRRGSYKGEFMANGDDQKESDRFIKNVDRFMKEFDRYIKESDRGPKESDRGPKESDRGPKESDRGSDGVVGDVFRRVTGLGGFFVCAFIAPVGGCQQGSPIGPDARRFVMHNVARKAQARDQEAAVQQPLSEETRKEIMDFLKQFMQQRAKAKKT